MVTAIIIKQTIFNSAINVSAAVIKEEFGLPDP